MAAVYVFPGASFTEPAAAATQRQQATPSARPLRRRPSGVAGRTGTGARPAVVRPAVVRPVERPLRLTRRGRIVVRVALVIAITVAAAVVVLLVGRPAKAGNAGHPMQVRYHVVMPGETLMQIAADEVPGVDPRDTVARLVDLNALPGSAIRAGQRIALPLDS